MTPTGQAGCARHNFLCAYTGSEPDRCPRCHASWESIAAHAAYPVVGGG
jgi:hypothetical protein